MLIMLLHPDVQKKAQQEIDRVLGEGKLPDFGDRESLPYVECVLQESMRFVLSLISKEDHLAHDISGGILLYLSVCFILSFVQVSP